MAKLNIYTKYQDFEFTCKTDEDLYDIGYGNMKKVTNQIHYSEKFQYIPLEEIIATYYLQLSYSVKQRGNFRDETHFINCLRINTVNALINYIKKANTQKRKPTIKQKEKNQSVTYANDMVDIHQGCNDFLDFELKYFLEQELSQEEYQIITMLIEGYTTREIRARLHIHSRNIVRAKDKLREIILKGE